MQMSLGTDTPRIYVACLAAYNAGILHGSWIDVDSDNDAIWSEIRNILTSSPAEDAEEWAIHDYEGFGMLRLSEYEGIERVAQLAAFIEEHGELGAALIAHFCGDLEDAKTALENYMGKYRSLADYAEELTTDSIQIPESLQSYIDYEAMARDMELNGDVYTLELAHDEIHVFLNH